MSLSIPELMVILTSLQPCALDPEQPEARGPRLHMVAIGLHHARLALCEGEDPLWPGDCDDLLWLLIAKGFWESRFASFVHDGTCKPFDCGGGRARSMWQLEHTPNFAPGDWDRIVGVSYASTGLAAIYAGEALAMGYRRCGSLHGAISLYATGKHCNWGEASRRLAWARRQQAKHEQRRQHAQEQRKSRAR